MLGPTHRKCSKKRFLKRAKSNNLINQIVISKSFVKDNRHENFQRLHWFQCFCFFFSWFHCILLLQFTLFLVFSAWIGLIHLGFMGFLVFFRTFSVFFPPRQFSCLVSRCYSYFSDISLLLYSSFIRLATQSTQHSSFMLPRGSPWGHGEDELIEDVV